MKLYLFILFSLCSFFINAQNIITISGFVYESKTEELLPGATISINDKTGTVTNQQSFYSIRVPKGKNRITVSFIGFNEVRIEKIFNHDTLINFYLEPKSTSIEEIIITPESSNSSFLERKTGTNRISSSEIKKQPVLLGEFDLLKSLQLLPGIQSGNEGSSGLYVRGGSPDQNLVLFDGVPIYNAYHLFGFFSVFNADAIRYANIIKGGIPAQYSGRLSSVIDITMKEGDMNQYGSEVTFGLIASKVVVEGPIKKGKSSFMLTGRRTNLDYFSQAINKSYVGNKGNDQNKFYFFDVNVKANYIITPRNRLFLSFYTGRDQSKTSSIYKESINDQNSTYQHSQATNLNWGNQIVSLRYNLILSPRTFINITGYSSNYEYVSSEKTTSTYSLTNNITKKTVQKEYVSNIYDLGAKLDAEYILHSGIRVKAGAQVVKHRYRPGVESFKSDNSNPELDVDTLFGKKFISKELSTYLETDIKILKKVSLNMGVNYNSYNTSDTLFNSLEPRANLAIPLSNNLSVKASYSSLSQNIHLLSNSTVGLPTDLWLPATKRVIPQKGQIYTFGIYTILYKQYQFSIESFYKDMKNLIAYREGASYFTGNLSWEDKVTIGKGWSYGLEFLLNKTQGKLNGTLAYTISRTERKFSDLNNGRVFPYKYDRRHDVSINLSYNIKHNATLSATWVFGTGNAITMPNMIAFTDMYYGGQGIFNTIYQVTESINGIRMPNYHRLDIGANFKKKLKWAERTLSVGIYNLYNRQNPYYIYIVYAPEGPIVKQKSLFPILPYVSYSLKF